MAVIDKKAYSEYIMDVRRKVGLNEAKFAKKIYRFTKAQCVPFARTSVINWEQGESLPQTKESLLCIALLDFCGSAEKKEHLSKEERNERLRFVNEKMEQYLGAKLYSRSIKEALLIQVARGVYSITEIQHVEEKFNLRKKKIKVSTKTETLRMMRELCEIDNPNEMELMVRKNEDYYNAGYKTLGGRIKKICEEIHPDLSFLMAICRYAPQYHSSHQRLFKETLSVSREYLVTLCFQLGFTKEQANQILASAQMRELKENEFPNSRFRLVQEMSISRKFCYLIYLMNYLKDDFCETIPYYFYLEGYLLLHTTEMRFVKLEEKIRDKMDNLIDNLEEINIDGIEELKKHIAAMDDVILKCSKEEQQDYKEFCGGFVNKYRLSFERMKGDAKMECEMVNAMYRVATFSYMLLLEKEYTGQLIEGDLEQLRAFIKEKPVYLFLNNLWTLFLDAGNFEMDTNGGVYGMRGEPLMRTKSFEWSDLMTNMVECCWMYLHEQ